MLHRYQNMFKVNIMRKISKADLSLRNLKKLIKKEFNETDKLIRNQINSDVNRIPKLSKPKALNRFGTGHFMRLSTGSPSANRSMFFLVSRAPN